ncbi:MAG: sulfotransferase domain-containing protein [Bacillota bacterium]
MQNILKYLSFITQKRQRSIWVPSVVRPDDVFIVSYPKSGNTWVRFLIANLLRQKNEEIDFHTVHQYIPEVGRHEEIIARQSRPRIMKSHSLYRPEYPKVIYIIRDGRDVYVSYYFHRLKDLPPGTTFKDFLKCKDHYPCSWGKHVSSWLFRKHQLSKILVVKYEELINDCTGQLKRMADFIGLDPKEDELRYAVEASSFQNMQRLELEKGRPYQNEGPEVFVRKGKPGNWKEFFGPEEKAIFKSRDGKMLIKLGYETNNEW